MASERAFRTVLFAAGAIATAAGLDTVVRGSRSIAGERRLASAAVESELRFYAAFYAAYGIAALRAAPRAANEPATVRALAGALLLAGAARAAGWRAAGAPHPGQRALLAVELAGPPALVAWQARLGDG